MISDFKLKFVGYLLSIVFLYLTFKDTNIVLIIEHLEYMKDVKEHIKVNLNDEFKKTKIPYLSIEEIKSYL